MDIYYANIKTMGTVLFYWCIVAAIAISFTASFCSSFVYDALQPYHCRQQLHRRRQQQHGVGNYVQQEHSYRKSSRLFYAKTDPSIIAYTDNI